MKKVILIVSTVLVLIAATFFADKATRVKATGPGKNTDQANARSLGQPAPEVTFKDLGVSMDEEGKSAVAPFLAKERFNVNGQKFPMNYPIVIGNDTVADKFGGILGYPTSFLVSRDGKIVKKVQGLISYEELTKAIEAQL